MDQSEIFNKAIVAVLYEASSKGVDIQELAQCASAGLMGGRIYAHASAEAKPMTVSALKEAVAEALHYIDIGKPAG